MSTSPGPGRRPDPSRSLVQYRRRAPHYDLELAPFEPVRRQAIAQLAAETGATVLDIGCGTGLSFELLRDKVGAQGRIVGIDPSPDMLALARQRIARHGWTGIELVEAGAAVVPTNLFVWAAALYSVTCMDGLEQPWTLLARRLSAFQVRGYPWMGIYIAEGRVPARH
ncbi:MAG TPA: methyltransferase domain-containing protein [Ramlibacter sp.]|jgi:demethylmenaquinone methyltransferase/2-methoxy-6-polyprenyl-1,4-benzoquinol methylase|nr:methyltransferase domain-containing protein [Ramlibacter sp.]